MPFLSEVVSTAHPPGFYLALKMSQSIFGYTRFAYRFVSLFASVATIPLLAIIARRLGYSRAAAIVPAVMFALSQSATIIACEVRSYALALLFLLIAFLFLSDLLVGSVNRWTIVGLALATGAAVATHYFTFIFIGVEAAVLAVTLARPEIRRRMAVAVTPLAVLTTAIVVGGAAALYFVQVRRIGRLTHLPRVYFDTNEAPSAFLSRNLVAFLNYFSPITVGSAAVATVIVVVCAIVLVVLLLRRPTALPAACTLLIFLAMLAGGFADLYPFGGDLRQQFFIFPFFLLAIAGVIDLVPKGRSIAVLGLVAFTIFNAVAWMRAFHIQPDELFTTEFESFERALGRGRVVIVDQFNVIIFFAHTHRQHWSVAGDTPADGVIEYAVGSDRRVIRDRRTWNYDLDENATLVRLRHIMQVCNVPAAAVFAIRQPEPPRSGGQRPPGSGFVLHRSR